MTRGPGQEATEVTDITAAVTMGPLQVEVVYVEDRQSKTLEYHRRRVVRWPSGYEHFLFSQENKVQILTLMSNSSLTPVTAH